MKISYFKKVKILLVVYILVIMISCNQSPSSEVEDKSPENKVIFHQSEDMGKQPWVFDIEESTIDNDNYRKAAWTGEYIQLVYMSLGVGEVIDLELHEDHDQFIRIEMGKARVLMGKTKENLDFDEEVSDDWAILIPAGYWHEVRNIGDSELKLYTIYGPPEHPKGTVNRTYEEANVIIIKGDF